MTNNESLKHFTKDDTIMRQGEAGTCAYIIESGSVEIYIEKENGLIQSLGTRGEGTIIGEMALIDQGPRTATIKALEDCSLLEITLPDFERRLNSSDPVIRMMIEVVLTRYRDMLHNSHLIVSPNAMNKSEALEKNYLKRSNAIDTLKMEQELREAFFNNDLALHYQPIFNIETNEVMGFEALIRWHHPKHGFISPEIFIPIAEDSRLILEISRWVLQTACKTLKQIDETLPLSESVFMSVNFSSIDLMDVGFETNFMRIINEENITPSRIHMEMTERLLIDDPEIARRTLEKCRDNGISISIDDFGTGYSSLSYLHYFPINVLKIDRSFVNDMSHDGNAIEIIRSIVNLGKSMNMKIIAEGIEEEKQQNLLRSMGCDAGQGYFHSKPMPIDELSSFLSQ